MNLEKLRWNLRLNLAHQSQKPAQISPGGIKTAYLAHHVFQGCIGVQLFAGPAIEPQDDPKRYQRQAQGR